MKLPPTPPGTRVPSGTRDISESTRRHKQGVALFIALSFLVLLSAVVLALFLAASTGRRNASAFATGQETQRLAEAAVNLVQGQIRDATIQPRVGWASQPGMIRAFDTSGTVTAHKLYSSRQMVVPNYGKAQIDAEFSEISAWNAGAPNRSFNAQFCDLNAPAVVKRPDPGNPANTIQTPVFPIADPAAIGAVEGFSANTTVAGTTLGTGANRRLPMPVRWLYVLQDGQMVAPSGGTANSATFSGPVLPTQSNPIVGRIAFWTDDETCKLNINTASEGTFWDTPRANTYSELRLSISMPVRGEFQRLVNHPAFTSLSPVFQNISGNYTRPSDDLISTTGSIGTTVANPDSYYKNFVSYYDITPRINGSLGTADKSSKGGAQRTSAVGRGGTSEGVPDVVWPISDQPSGGGGEFKKKGAPLDPDTDRLYAVPDEVLFTPGRTSNRDLTAQAVALRSFFLTANSRAPETTVFGTPKISLWPQQKSPSHRNIRDRLLDFCSTVGNRTYAFQREIAQNGIYLANLPSDSQTHDINLGQNEKILGYLQKLTSTNLPGYASSLAAKWGAGGRDKILAQTFDMVRANTNSFYINFGGSNGTTYRYATTSRKPTEFIDPTSASGLTVDRANGPTNGVVPARFGAAMGMGRNVIFDQLAIVFMAREVVNTYTSNNSTVTETSDGETYSVSGNLTGDPTAQTTNKVCALLLFNPYLASPSFPAVVPGLQIEIKGFGAMSLNGTNFVAGNPTLRMRAGSQSSTNADEHNRHSQLSNPFGMFQVFANRPDPAHMAADQKPSLYQNRVKFKNAVSNGSDMDRHYPFVSQDIPVSGSIIPFSGGTLEITIKNWKGTETIGNFTVNFPPANIPAPQHLGTNLKFSGGNVTSINLDTASGETAWPSNILQPGDYLSPRKRLIGNSNSKDTQTIAVRPGDVVLGVGLAPGGATRGDLRLLALSPNVPGSWFAPFPGYGNAATQFNGVNPADPNTTAAIEGRFAFGFRSAGPMQENHLDIEPGWVKKNAASVELRSSHQATAAATLVAGLAMDHNASPATAPGLQGATMAGGLLGDWASGVGGTPDGAFFPVNDPGDSNLLFGGYFGTKKPLFVPTGDTWEPNRLVPSSGVLGHLLSPDSSGSLSPWRTLLFTRQPAAGNSHPGFATASLPPDHIYLDNFWMPVVEPYPISEPTSTAGKVNLNFQMLPFAHIERSTAFHGALRGLRLNAVPDSASSTYKGRSYTSPTSEIIRHPLSSSATISGMFQEVFHNGNFFKTPSEVCGIQLVAEGQTAATMPSWWATRRITSDTLREQPYTALLSRVTTKSNTFTVHYRVQALRQAPRPGRNWAEWDEGRDQVAGEYRGSTTIERFLDPNAQNIPDYTQANLSGNYDPIDKWYRWRVLSQKQFAP